MAKKKTSKTSKKTSKKRRTPAQVAATKRLVAANKARAKGGTRKKTAKKKTAKKRTAKRASAPTSGVAHEIKRLADRLSSCEGKLRGAAPKRRAAAKSGGKKKTTRKSSSKKMQSVSAESILAGARDESTKYWLCSGLKRTGCGGGKAGGHVVTAKGSFKRLRK